MPTLDWIGKSKVINHHQDVPFRVLEKQYSYGEDSGNMIIRGDNLEALKALLPRYEGKVKCIYIEAACRRETCPSSAKRTPTAHKAVHLSDRERLDRLFDKTPQSDTLHEGRESAGPREPIVLCP